MEDYRVIDKYILLPIPHFSDWLVAFHLQLLLAILFIAV
jgi:hypothetical protein